MALLRIVKTSNLTTIIKDGYLVMMSTEIKSMNNVSNEEVFDAMKAMSDKAGVKLVDMAIADGFDKQGFVFITDCPDGKDGELDYIATGYFLGLNDINGNDYDIDDYVDDYGCPHFSLYVIGEKQAAFGKSRVYEYGMVSVAWMNGGVNLL